MKVSIRNIKINSIFQCLKVILQKYFPKFWINTRRQGIPQDDLASPAMLSLKFHVFFPSLVDSEKSLSPLVDETQPFTVPFRPYDWISYPGVALRAPLVRQSLHPPSMEMDGRPPPPPPPMSFYIDGSRSSLYAERTACVDYERRTTALLFPADRGPSGKPHGAQARSELLCPGLMRNGAYKCVKCTKVRISLWKHKDGIYSSPKYVSELQIQNH